MNTTCKLLAGTFILNFLFMINVFAVEKSEEIPIHPGTFRIYAVGGTVIEGFYFKDEDVNLLRSEWRSLQGIYHEIEAKSRQLEKESKAQKHFSFYAKDLLTSVSPDLPVSKYEEAVLAAQFENYIAGVGFILGTAPNQRTVSIDELMASEIYNLYSDWYREHYRVLKIWPGTGSSNLSKRTMYDYDLCQLAKNDPDARITRFTTKPTGVYFAESPEIKLRFWESREEWLESKHWRFDPEVMSNWFCMKITNNTSVDPYFMRNTSPVGFWIAMRVQEVSHNITWGFSCGGKGCFPQSKKLDRTWRHRYKTRWKEGN